MAGGDARASIVDEYWHAPQQFTQFHHAGANADDASGSHDDHLATFLSRIPDFYSGRRIGWIDGFIAKRFDLRTELGAYLDPLADKALLISIYVSLAIYAGLPAWIAITVVSRDVMILMAVLVSWLLDKPVEIRPVWVSKLNTVAQITLAGFALGVRAYGLDQPLLQTSLNGWSPGQPWPRAASTSPSG